MTLEQASAEAPTPFRGGRTAPICFFRVERDLLVVPVPGEFGSERDDDEEGKINTVANTTRKTCCNDSINFILQSCVLRRSVGLALY